MAKKRPIVRMNAVWQDRLDLAKSFDDALLFKFLAQERDAWQHHNEKMAEREKAEQDVHRLDIFPQTPRTAALKQRRLAQAIASTSETTRAVLDAEAATDAYVKSIYG